jgi:hypothetical protein
MWKVCSIVLHCICIVKIPNQDQICTDLWNVHTEQFELKSHFNYQRYLSKKFINIKILSYNSQVNIPIVFKYKYTYVFNICEKSRPEWL